MDDNTVLLFTRFGLGEAPGALQQKLVSTFLSLTVDSKLHHSKILCYTEGVKLACQGSPVLSQLEALEKAGVEVVLCKTCLDYFGLTEQVKVGIVGGMTDIIEAMSKAGKVISL